MRIYMGRTAAFFLAIATCCGPILAQSADLSSPLGLWKTIDDKTGKARSLLRIYEQNGKIFGKVEKSFEPGAESRKCVKCTDERKDQPMIGLLIIREMKLQDGEYRGGDILDPESGSVYRCRLSLLQDGRKLKVRGFIGIALLGRTQVWERDQ